MLTSTGASAMMGSPRVEPVVEAVIIVGQLADLDAATLRQQGAAAGQRNGRVEAAGPDQRVAAQRRVGRAGPQRGRGERRAATVLEAGAEPELPGRPGVEGGGGRRVARRWAEGEQVGRHRRSAFGPGSTG